MRIALILSAALSCTCPAALAWASPDTAEPMSAPAQVLVLGTYHFDNPGLDMHNVEAVDVLSEPAQAQIEALVEALAGFAPNRVFVEWPAEIADQRYGQFLAGELPPSRNEVVQLGFRLAQRQELARVHGIDVPGEFPFGPIMEWAMANDRAGELQAGQARIAAGVREIERLQNEKGIAAALRFMNQEDNIREGHGLYMSLLRYGSGEQQPGVDLNTAWFARNAQICARLLQTLEAGDRAVVIFGAGHSGWLQRCVLDTPGVEWVAAERHLPRD